MKPGTILIRADASVSIGTGHVMRCLALAQAWQDAGGEAAFALAQSSPSVSSRLQSENARLFSMYSISGSVEDAEETARLAREVGAGWVVVDGYRFDRRYEERLKQEGLKVLLVDDSANGGDHAADLVLNQNAYASRALYRSCGANARFLLGPGYALLRREFRSERGFQRAFPPVAGKVLVTMGGSDPENLTLGVIEALAMIETANLEAVVIAGATNRHADSLREAAARSHGNIRVLCSVANMPEWMKWADVAVSAAGSTSWEICFLGLPAILIDLAANQTPVARELHRLGAARHLGNAQAALPEYIATALKTLMASAEERISISRKASALVDGLGALRVVSAIRSEDLELRRVELGDCRLLWQWANDPNVRAASFSTDAIGWDEHVAWLSNRLADADSRMLIALEDGSPIGQIRLDRIDDQEAEIDISVAPECRGRGYASRMLERTAWDVFRERSFFRLHGFIRPENQVSARAFEKAGFRRVGEATMRGHQAFHYLLECEEEMGA